MALRTSLLAAACLLLAGLGFVLLHSGAPGDAACERSLFVPSAGFSAWPPGARCEYGEPNQTEVVVNGWFAAVVFALGVAFAAARAIGRPSLS
jgi:hypothetical protein